jgi:hypothetical protein
MYFYSTFFFLNICPQEEANRKQTSSSTYAVEDSSDIPPPRYQKDGRLSPYYQSNTNQMMIHPKIMPNASQMSFLPSSNFDDQFINQKSYPSKNYSPGPPPLDGSYYSACDRYLSYPPMVSVCSVHIRILYFLCTCARTICKFI